MHSLNPLTMITDGLILSLAIGVVILGSLYANARLWLQDYPAEIRAKVPPLSRAEKRMQGLVMVLFLGVGFGAIAWSFSRLEAANGGNLPFLAAYANAFVMLNIFNLFDAVVIDWLIIAVMQPKFVELPGAENMGHLYRNWALHIQNYFKGVVICAILSLVIALLTQL